MSLTRPPLQSFLPTSSLYCSPRLFRIVATASNGENGTATNREETPPLNSTNTTTKQAKRKLKGKSRRRVRDEEERLLEMAASSPGRLEREKKKKEWEEMTLAEKAIELYLGEKGLLFWLNKFAYASIFIIVGAWILFRFVGPSLGLYQLDSPPLAPSDLLGGK